MPTKVMQTVISGPKANCMEACLASYFSINIHDVPIIHQKKNWQDILKKWLKPFGLGFSTIAVPNEKLFVKEMAQGYQIVAGYSERDIKHAVIYLDGKLWHDPHPEQCGILSVMEVDFFHALTPKYLWENY